MPSRTPSRASSRQLAVTLCMVVAGLLVAASTSRAQISPGPLARAHAALEGPRNCTQCHGGRNESTTQRCLGCHREIAWLQQQGQGFHARRDARGTCSSCHPDHAGRDFALIQWPGGSPERFDHARGAGYPLEGSHATAKCTACHTTRLRVSAAATLSPRRGTTGWVGLETNCTSCHEDPHRGALDGACTRCHDTGRWKDAPLFDHARTSYPLTGKHEPVKCAACHMASRLNPRMDSAGRPVPVFRPVPFKDCVSCHTDPHRGRLTGACSNCHVTSSFRTIDRAAFNHERTRYPLRGRHTTVACASCHVGFPSAGMRPASVTCGACHRDPHDGEATIAGKPADCATCHRVEGFTPATFTVDQHQRTAFPLLGRHARVACGSCHGGSKTASVAARTLIRPARSCAACHTDAHGSQLAARPDAGACSTCHSAEGWRPSTFGIASHASLRLPLDGAHARVPCASCHATNRPGLRALPTNVAAGTARIVMRPPETTCAQCHADPHAWRQPGAAPACTACHSSSAFRPTMMSASAHATTGYPLEGAHLAVPCFGCHESMARAPAPSTLVAAAPGVGRLDLRTPRATCAGCHADPHRNQLTATGSGACERCHTVRAFAPASLFDHARDARFRLDGAHARVPCTACHRQPSGATPGASIAYGGLSAACESCHTAPASPPRARP